MNEMGRKWDRTNRVSIIVKTGLGNTSSKRSQYLKGKVAGAASRVCFIKLFSHQCEHLSVTILLHYGINIRMEIFNAFGIFPGVF